jgi:hypothetical protein
MDLYIALNFEVDKKGVGGNIELIIVYYNILSRMIFCNFNIML